MERLARTRQDAVLKTAILLTRAQDRVGLAVCLEDKSHRGDGVHAEDAWRSGDRFAFVPHRTFRLDLLFDGRLVVEHGSKMAEELIAVPHDDVYVG